MEIKYQNLRVLGPAILKVLILKVIFNEYLNNIILSKK